MTIWFLQAAVRESRITPALVAVSYTFDCHVTSTLGCYNYAPYISTGIWFASLHIKEGSVAMPRRELDYQTEPIETRTLNILLTWGVDKQEENEVGRRWLLFGFQPVVARYTAKGRSYACKTPCNIFIL